MVPSLANPRAPESKCARSWLSKREAMRDWIAWIAGVLIVMSGCSCAWAVPIPTSDSQSNLGPSDALWPPGLFSCTASLRCASSPLPFSTTSLAASFASAAGTYTLHVTLAGRLQALQQRRPVDTSVEADHRQPGHSRSFDDNETRAG